MGGVMNERESLFPSRPLFFLGAHHISQKWWDTGVPLFVSRRTLASRKTLPIPRDIWALDSGGFTELDKFRGWKTTPEEYVRDVQRFKQMGRLSWVAPQDWMCEPQMLEKTGLTVEEHQWRTVLNFLDLRDQLGTMVIPVLQGWERDDYHRCWEMYDAADVSLEDEAVVGLGTVCRRQNTAEAEVIVRSLAPLSLHGFGVKMTGIALFGDGLVSADSLAWSYNGRRSGPCPYGARKNCANCIHHALDWRERLLSRIEQKEAA